MTHIRACVCLHKQRYVHYTGARSHIHRLAHVCFVLLIRLSLYQMRHGLALWEALRELSGHSD